jgi:hypothetical protein
LEREEFIFKGWVRHPICNQDRLLVSIHAAKSGVTIHVEYWIPAEKLDEFNRNIVGLIEMVSQFRGK